MLSGIVNIVHVFGCFSLAFLRLPHCMGFTCNVVRGVYSLLRARSCWGGGGG